MEVLKVDVAIIGAGTAGLNAQREAASAGASWVLIESGPYGTMCARVGCMPSKLLIAAADAAQEVREAERFGIEVAEDGWEINGTAVMARVRSERDRFAGFAADATEALPEQNRLRGRAHFVGTTTLEVGDHTRVEAKSVVVATGSSPRVPDELDAVREEVMVNDDVFELTELPDSVAIVGTGAIGLELGQALHRLGVRVALFNPRSSLGPLTDPALRAAARQTFDQELTLHLETELLGAERSGDGFSLRYRDAQGAEHEERFGCILAATGRRPNLSGLGLETAGCQLDPNGLPSWDPTTTQCGDLPIFIAGDVSAHSAVLHEAADEGRIAGANAARWPEVAASVRRTRLMIAFTDPQMALVGERFADLSSSEIEVGAASYDNQGRARVMGKNRGLVHVYGSRSSCRLLGAEMFGPRVEHTSHLLAWAVQQGLTINHILQMPVYHPVIEEGIRAAFRDLAKKLKVSTWCPPADRSEGPGA